LHHILDPGTGCPAPVYWAAVSVAGATCVDANIASTAAMIRGRPAARWLEDMRMPARLVRPHGAVACTAGWPR
jgi:FAD:protein FMN transferase